MIFQDAGASLCPIRTIGEQIYESMCAHTKITRSEAKTRAMDLFDKLNFKDSQRVWDSYPFELSGGMNQRAGIAIAMLMNPPILFADEPTSALDVSVQHQVVREMLKLRELFGTAIVIVTHDIGVVRAMADTVLVLKNGKTVEYGTADRVLDHPRDPYTRKLLEAVPKLQRKVRV
jgi:nickel_nikD: nickel import ATP-binding protein NikD